MEEQIEDDIERKYKNKKNKWQRRLGLDNEEWESVENAIEEIVFKGPTICCVIFLVLIVVLIATSIAVIAPNEVGLKWVPTKASLSEELYQTGINFMSPFSKVVRWPSKQTTIEFVGENRVECNSKDGLKIIFDTSFQFTPEASHLYELTKTFRDFDNYVEFVTDSAMSVATHTCGDFSAEEFQTRRSSVALELESEISEELFSLFRARVAQVQLNNIRRPNDYERVVTEKENSRSEIALAENERAQAITRGETDVAFAEQEVFKVKRTAQQQAEAILAGANFTGEGIKGKYEAFAHKYGLVKTEYGLSEEAILTYVSNELFSGKDTKLTVQAPSQLVYKDSLQ